MMSPSRFASEVASAALSNGMNPQSGPCGECSSLRHSRCEVAGCGCAYCIIHPKNLGDVFNEVANADNYTRRSIEQMVRIKLDE
jgi:hypothetical protein